MAAIPDELIDTVSLCGPTDVVRERLAVYRDAGVGTLGVTPMAFTARSASSSCGCSPSSPPERGGMEPHGQRPGASCSAPSATRATRSR